MRIVWTLRICYLLLLLGLLPHTAYTFSLLEPAETKWLGWFMAIVFEITIAVLTHDIATEIATDLGKLSEEERAKVGVRRQLTYLWTIPGVLLASALCISMVANWTHAYAEVGRPLDTGQDPAVFLFATPGVPLLYSILFGGILPVCSLGYAFVLSRKHMQEGTGVVQGTIKMRVIQAIMGSTGKLSPQTLARLANVPVAEVDDAYYDAKQHVKKRLAELTD